MTRDQVLAAFDRWRAKLPEDRGFNHSEGLAFVKEIEALASWSGLAEPAQAPVIGWQPIETHDGSTEPVVVGFPHHLARQQFYRTVGQWDGTAWRGSAGRVISPTHFMSLPAPPEEPKASAEPAQAPVTDVTFTAAQVDRMEGIVRRSERSVVATWLRWLGHGDLASRVDTGAHWSDNRLEEPTAEAPVIPGYRHDPHPPDEMPAFEEPPASEAALFLAFVETLCEDDPVRRCLEDWRAHGQARGAVCGTGSPFARPASEAADIPKPVDVSFLRGVVRATTSYDEGWREVCARLLWAEHRLFELTTEIIARRKAGANVRRRYRRYAASIDKLETQIQQFTADLQGALTDAGDIPVPSTPAGVIEAVRQLAAAHVTRTTLDRAAWELSTYAASIHWDGGRNTRDWLAGLRDRIRAVQQLRPDLAAGGDVTTAGPDRYLEGPR